MSTPAAAETRREAPNQGNPFMGLLGRLGNTMQQIAKEVRTSSALSLSGRGFAMSLLSCEGNPAAYVHAECLGTAVGLSSDLENMLILL